MSAYALPGVIFPPIRGETRTPNTLSLDGTSFDRDDTRSGNQQIEKNSNQSNATFNPYAQSLFMPSPLKAPQLSADDVSPPSMLKYPTNLESKRCAPLPRHQSQNIPEVTIVVEDANLDSASLIKLLTTRPSKRKRKETLLMLRKESCSNMEKEGTDVEPQHDPQLDAIQFTLSISQNGRSYRATRTLPTIIQLREDLVAELSSSTPTLVPRRRRNQTKAYMKQDKSDTTTTTTKIPVIPEMSDGMIVGYASQGFSMLQARLQTFRPKIDAWFQQLLNTVELNTSPSFLKFLWEPVSTEVSVTPKGKLLRLVSIEEEEDAKEEGLSDMELSSRFEFIDAATLNTRVV